MEKIYSGYKIDINKNTEDIAYNGKVLKIEGNSEQETREGYNLLNANLPYTTSSSGNTIKWLGKENIPKIEVNKYYYLHGKFSDGTIFSGAHAAFVITDSREQILNKIFGSSFQNTVDISNATNCYIYTDSTYVNKTVTEVAIYEGKENKAYEQYGVSPSPDYPSEVESCGDNINIFDGLFESGDLNSVNGSNETNVNRIRSVNYIEVKENQDIIFSPFDITRLIMYDKDKKFLKYQGSLYGKSIKTVSKTKYIRFSILNTDINIKEKVEEGSTATEYSPYGQGCITEVICNKNLSKYKNFTSTSSARIVGDITSSGQQIKGIKVKKGKKYTVSFDIAGLPASDYRIQIKESTDENVTQTSGEIPNIIQNEPLTCNTLARYSKTITAQGDNYLYIRCVPNGFVLDNIQVEEKETATSYEQHQEQKYIIPTQQPFRAIDNVRDTFIKKDDKWYERHYITRKIFDGTEDWKLYGTNASTYRRFGLAITENIPKIIKILSDGDKFGKGICSHFKVDMDYKTTDLIEFIQIGSPSWYIGITDFNSKWANVEALKTYLSEQYNAGTPVYVDYILETPKDIECTPKQEIRLEKLLNFELYNGVNHIYSTDEIEPLLTIEYHYEMEDYDFYLSSDGYLNIPSLGIRYLVDLNESSIPIMPEAVESSVRVAGRDGDVPLKTTYEPIPFNIVCYTEDNLTATEKTEEESKINMFLNSIKNKTKKFALERNTRFYDVKYNGALTTINYPKFLKFSIPFKSSDSYGKDITEKIMSGNEKTNSNTIKETGALIKIGGPANSPIISLNDYSIEYDSVILEGARIEIDTNKSTVTHINADGVKTNAMKYYNHQFPKIENGENELKVLSGLDDENRVTIKWNDLKL